LTEGDSAKGLAMAGISVVGSDNYGVFPLKGKLLNVREASAEQLLKNEEIINIKKILGLAHDKDYADLSELRYGRIILMCDQDLDGFHIKGLLMNFFHYFWPSLLQHDNFITALATPIVKATKNSGKKDIKTFL
jgi:DNA topoisomerase-2